MDLTTLAVAAVGLAGTLTSPLIGQRIAAQTKRQEFHFETERRHAELEEARRQSALELKRSIYARLKYCRASVSPARTGGVRSRDKRS